MPRRTLSLREISWQMLTKPCKSTEVANALEAVATPPGIKEAFNASANGGGGRRLGANRKLCYFAELSRQEKCCIKSKDGILTCHFVPSRAPHSLSGIGRSSRSSNALRTAECWNIAAWAESIKNNAYAHLKNGLVRETFDLVASVEEKRTDDQSRRASLRARHCRGWWDHWQV